MARCYKANSARYADYGGRGIAVAPEWHDPAVFYADMGARPAGGTLERMDNDAGYSPDNCRWATKKEQNNNRRSTTLITFAGKTLSAAAWAEEVGVNKTTMYTRLRNWPLELALTVGKLR